MLCVVTWFKENQNYAWRFKGDDEDTHNREKIVNLSCDLTKGHDSVDLAIEWV